MRLEKVLLGIALIVATLSSVTEGHPIWKPIKFKWWQRFLCSYWYNWPRVNKAESPEPTERISMMRTLNGSCKFDVGTCQVDSCSTKRKFSEFCPDDGYICPVTETRTADCGVFGRMQFEYVKHCGCCKHNGVHVTGVVRDAATNEALDKINVYYNAMVKESQSDVVTPAQFQTPERDTVQQLKTDEFASFNFESNDGSSLKHFVPVKFTGREGMKVWELKTKTGLWEPASVAENRRKRQVTLEDLINVESQFFFNIDDITGAPSCYFKGRIFDETSGDEIMTSASASFRPEITAYTSTGQRLRLIAGYTNESSTTCYEVKCPDVSNPDDALAGFINMTATEVISVGRVKLPFKTYLTPREYSSYDVILQPELSAVQYKIAPNYLDIFVNFVSNTSGPFFEDKNDCESSSVTQPAFHFFKPEPPSYEPIPDDTEICTARITFKDSGNFYSYASTLDELPNVSGISIWEQDSTNFYFTDVALMEFSANRAFIFICLKYRCSQENEATTVYLDIEIPTDDESSSEQTKAFICVDNIAEGSLISGQRVDESATIEGSFVAPKDVRSGPDFYDSETSDCKEETDSETFAYEFFCSSKQT